MELSRASQIKQMMNKNIVVEQLTTLGLDHSTDMNKEESSDDDDIEFTPKGDQRVSEA